VLPFGERLPNVRRASIDRKPELLQVGPVSASPMPQRRPRNATPAANHTGAANLLEKLNPAETSSRAHEVPRNLRMAADPMEGVRRPQLHSHNRIINQ
jgi:hypothetical protein